MGAGTDGDREPLQQGHGRRILEGTCPVSHVRHKVVTVRVRCSDLCMGKAEHSLPLCRKSKHFAPTASPAPPRAFSRTPGVPLSTLPATPAGTFKHQAKSLGDTSPGFLVTLSLSLSAFKTPRRRLYLALTTRASDPFFFLFYFCRRSIALNARPPSRLRTAPAQTVWAPRSLSACVVMPRNVTVGGAVGLGLGAGAGVGPGHQGVSRHPTGPGGHPGQPPVREAPQRPW